MKVLLVFCPQGHLSGLFGLSVRLLIENRLLSFSLRCGEHSIERSLFWFLRGGVNLGRQVGKENLERGEENKYGSKYIV